MALGSVAGEPLELGCAATPHGPEECDLSCSLRSPGHQVEGATTAPRMKTMEHVFGPEHPGQGRPEPNSAPKVKE